MKIRKTAVYILVIMAAAMFALAGCSPGKVDISIKGQDGEEVSIKTDESGAKISMEGKDGKLEITGDEEGGKIVMQDAEGTKTMVVGKDADVSDIGVDLYPGAEVESGGKMTAGGGTGGSYRSAVLVTSDPVEKVAEFYRGKIEGATVVDMVASQGAIMFTLTKDETTKTVTVQKDQNDPKKTRIAIVVIQSAK